MRRNRFGSPLRVLRQCSSFPRRRSLPQWSLTSVPPGWLGRRLAFVFHPDCNWREESFWRQYERKPLIWNVGSQWPIGKEKIPIIFAQRSSSAVVVVNGSDETVQALQRVRGDTPLIAHGSRRSIAVIDAVEKTTGAAWRPFICDGLARDVLLWGQRGCTSPTVLFVVGQQSISPEACRDSAIEELRSRWEVNQLPMEDWILWAAETRNEELGSRKGAVSSFPESGSCRTHRRADSRGERRVSGSCPGERLEEPGDAFVSAIALHDCPGFESPGTDRAPGAELGCVPDCLSGGSAKSGSGVATMKAYPFFGPFYKVLGPGRRNS